MQYSSSYEVDADMSWYSLGRTAVAPYCPLTCEAILGGKGALALAFLGGEYDDEDWHYSGPEHSVLTFSEIYASLD